MRSLSRAGRPLTNRYWPSALARVSVGNAAKPSMCTPSRSAAISTALPRKSAPSTSPRRAHGFGLGAIEFEEFQPRRCRVKEIAHLDTGALPERGGLGRGLHAGVDLD